MSRHEIRIDLAPRPRWSRWVDRLRGRAAQPAARVRPVNVDMTLVSRVAADHVRDFVETIDDYQLLTNRTVRVLSHFQMPRHDGLQATLPTWISERIRFGVVEADGRDFRYALIRSMEMCWGDGGTELLLHLDERIAPGTRAFIAAYLGDGNDAQALRELPFSSLPV